MFILIFVLFFIILGVVSIILLLKKLHKIVIYKNKSKYLMNSSNTLQSINFFKNKSNDIYISELTKLNPPFLFYTLEEWSLENNNNYYSIEPESDKYFIICKGYYYYLSEDFCINNLIINNDIIISIFNLKKYYNKIKIIE